MEFAESHGFRGCDSYFRIIQEEQKQKQKQKQKSIACRLGYTLR